MKTGKLYRFDLDGSYAYYGTRSMSKGLRNGDPLIGDIEPCGLYLMDIDYDFNVNNIIDYCDIQTVFRI